MKKQRRWGKRFLCASLILFGVGLYLYPDISAYLLNRHTQAYLKEFEEAYGTGETPGAESKESTEGENPDTEHSTAEPSTADTAYRELLEECLAYNQSLYESGQAGLTDRASYEAAGVDLTALETAGFGYIEIPAMDVVLPLYLGASTANMAKGAAVLGQTSLPTGGEDANCVIAGHRGYRGAAYFREIEKLSVGDFVYITNPWETLAYVVTGINIVDPDDADAIKIQEGKDMVTLLTCHPYRSHGKYRYLVYCERYTGEGTAEETAGDTEDTEDTPGIIQTADGAAYASSEPDIQREQLVRRLAALLILGMVGTTGILTAIRKKREKKERTPPDTGTYGV